MKIKKWKKFNELKSDTYYNASDKSKKFGNYGLSIKFKQYANIVKEREWEIINNLLYQYNKKISEKFKPFDIIAYDKTNYYKYYDEYNNYNINNIKIFEHKINNLDIVKLSNKNVFFLLDDKSNKIELLDFYFTIVNYFYDSHDNKYYFKCENRKNAIIFKQNLNMILKYYLEFFNEIKKNNISLTNYEEKLLNGYYEKINNINVKTLYDDILKNLLRRKEMKKFNI